MQAVDMDSFAQAITEHYEVYSKRPPDPKTVAAWFRTLKPLSLERVKAALVAHSRRGKFPATPAHVFEISQSLDEADAVERPLSPDVQRTDQFWTSADLLVAAHMAWVQGPHHVRRCYDSAMVNACTKAQEEKPGAPLPEAMRALIAKLPQGQFPKESARVSQ